MHTFAEALKGAGYQTFFAGKWHLGGGKQLPHGQGFDVQVGAHRYGQPGSYSYPYENANHPRYNVPDLEDGQSGDYLTDILTDKTLEFIEANHNEPFLVYLSHYAAMIQSLDDSVGRVMEKV